MIIVYFAIIIKLNYTWSAQCMLKVRFTQNYLGLLKIFNIQNIENIIRFLSYTHCYCFEIQYGLIY